MEFIAPRVWLIQIWRGYRINAYILGDVLVDTGTRWDYSTLRRAIGEVKINEIALTHVHPDHQGCAHRLCMELGVPLACPRDDVSAMEGQHSMPPNHLIGNLIVPLICGPPHTVTRVLENGSSVSEFTVIHAPGHTPGHSVLFRESDRVLIAGDILANINFLTGATGLREPPRLFSSDWRRNRESIRALAALNPEVICFGHGPPLRGTREIEKFLEKIK